MEAEAEGSDVRPQRILGSKPGYYKVSYNPGLAKSAAGTSGTIRAPEWISKDKVPTVLVDLWREQREKRAAFKRYLLNLQKDRHNMEAELSDNSSAQAINSITAPANVEAGRNRGASQASDTEMDRDPHQNADALRDKHVFVSKSHSVPAGCDQPQNDGQGRDVTQNAIIPDSPSSSPEAQMGTMPFTRTARRAFGWMTRPSRDSESANDAAPCNRQLIREQQPLPPIPRLLDLKASELLPPSSQSSDDGPEIVSVTLARTKETASQETPQRGATPAPEDTSKDIFMDAPSEAPLRDPQATVDRSTTQETVPSESGRAEQFVHQNMTSAMTEPSRSGTNDAAALGRGRRRARREAELSDSSDEMTLLRRTAEDLQEQLTFTRGLYEDASSSAAMMAEELQKTKREVEILQKQLDEGIKFQQGWTNMLRQKWETQTSKLSAQLNFAKQQHMRTDQTIREKAQKWDKHQEREWQDLALRQRRWELQDARREREVGTAETIHSAPPLLPCTDQALELELRDLADEAQQAFEPSTPTQRPVRSRRAAARAAMAAVSATFHDVPTRNTQSPTVPQAMPMAATHSADPQKLGAPDSQPSQATPESTSSQVELHRQATAAPATGGAKTTTMPTMPGQSEKQVVEPSAVAQSLSESQWLGHASQASLQHTLEELPSGQTGAMMHHTSPQVLPMAPMQVHPIGPEQASVLPAVRSTLARDVTSTDVTLHSSSRFSGSMQLLPQGPHGLYTAWPQCFACPSRPASVPAWHMPEMLTPWVQHLTPQAGAPGPPAAVFAHLPSNVQNFLARVRELQAGGQATVQSIVVDHHTAAQHHGRFPVNIHPMRRSAWADAPQAESFFLPGDGEPLKQQDVVTDTASAALQPSEAVCVFQQQPQSNALGLASVSNSSSMIEPEPLPSAEAATRPTVSALTVDEARSTDVASEFTPRPRWHKSQGPDTSDTEVTETTQPTTLAAEGTAQGTSRTGSHLALTRNSSVDSSRDAPRPRWRRSTRAAMEQPQPSEGNNGLRWRKSRTSSSTTSAASSDGGTSTSPLSEKTSLAHALRWRRSTDSPATVTTATEQAQTKGTGSELGAVASDAIVFDARKELPHSTESQSSMLRAPRWRKHRVAPVEPSSTAKAGKAVTFPKNAEHTDPSSDKTNLTSRGPPRWRRSMSQKRTHAATEQDAASIEPGTLTASPHASNDPLLPTKSAPVARWKRRRIAPVATLSAAAPPVSTDAGLAS